MLSAGGRMHTPSPTSCQNSCQHTDSCDELLICTAGALVCGGVPQVQQLPLPHSPTHCHASRMLLPAPSCCRRCRISTCTLLAQRTAAHTPSAACQQHVLCSQSGPHTALVGCCASGADVSQHSTASGCCTTLLQLQLWSSAARQRARAACNSQRVQPCLGVLQCCVHLQQQEPPLSGVLLQVGCRP